MSLFLQGLAIAKFDGAEMARGLVGAGAGADPDEEELSFSNAVRGPGLPAYMTVRGGASSVRGDMAGPLGTIIPGSGPLTYFLAMALGIALGGIPAALLIPKIGFWKGYLAGASISGAALTALYYAGQNRTTETTSTKGCG